MKTMKGLLGLAVLSSLMNVSLSLAGNEGGGGGGICTPNKCMTLAQAGLRVDDERTKRFEIEQAVIEEIQSIVMMLPAYFEKDLLIKSAIGYEDTFIVVDNKKQKKFKKFAEEYRKIIKTSNKKYKNFQLLAVSQGKKTYLLPGFDLLDIRGKALILLHEALIRVYNASVSQALIFDGHVLDILQSIEEGSLKSYDNWPFIELLGDLNMFDRKSSDTNRMALKMNLWKSLLDKGLRIQAGDLGGNWPGYNDTLYYKISRDLALSMRKHHPDFSRNLSNSVLYYTPLTIDQKTDESLFRYRDIKLREALQKICKEDPTLSDEIVIENFGDSPFHFNLVAVELTCK